MDSMRAVAAIAVVGFHTGNSFGVADVASSVRPYAGRLNVGVWIFFVISGFLLYRPSVAARLSGGDSPTIGGYAWRRFLRIFPGYWVALTVFTIWTGASGVFTVSDAPRQYLLIQNYWATTYTNGLGQAWSLSVELTFYVALGLLIVLFGRLARRRGSTTIGMELAVVAVLIVTGVAYRWVTMHTTLARPSAYLGWYIDAFGAGMLLAVLSVHFDRLPRRPALVRAIERFPVLPWAVALVGYWAVSTQIGLTGDYLQGLTIRQTMLESLYYTAIAVLVVLPAIWGEQRQGVVRKLLDNPVMRYLGKISYGIFLYEGLALVELSKANIQTLTVPHLTYLLWWAITLGLSAAFATASWYLIEAPALRQKRLVPRFSRRSTADPEPVVDPALLVTPPTGG